MATVFTQRSVPGSITGEYYGVAVSQDGKWIGLGPAPGNGELKILRKNDGDQDYGTVQTPSGLPAQTQGISDMVFGPNSNTLYVGTEGKVHVLNLVADVWTYDRALAPTLSGVAGVDVDDEERLVAIAASNGAAFIFRLTDNTIISAPSFGAVAQDVKFSPGGRYVAWACQTIGLRVYDRGSPLTDTFTPMTVDNGPAAVANWAVQFNNDNNRLISGSIFDGAASSGFKLDTTGTPKWVGQTLQTAHNIVGATYMDGDKAITSSNSAAAPDLWLDPNFTSDTHNIPAMGSHAMRAGRGTQYGSAVLAITRTAASGGGVAVYTLPFTVVANINASFSLPALGFDAELNATVDLEANFTLPNFGLSSILVNAAGDVVPAIPQAFRPAVIGLEAAEFTEETEFLPLAQIEFTYGAYKIDIGAGLETTAEIEFTYGAYSMEILQGISIDEIVFTYGAYDMEAILESRNAAHIAWSYGSYSMSLSGFQPVGAYINFSYGAYAMAIEADAEFGATVDLGYGAYGMELNADVSLPAYIEFTYGAYDIAIEGTAPVVADITFTYGAYDMAAFMSQPNSIIFSYGAYGMEVVASTPVVLDARLTYGRYGMALRGSMIKKAEIEFSYGSYGMEIVGEVVSNNTLTFMIIQP